MKTDLMFIRFLKDCTARTCPSEEDEIEEVDWDLAEMRRGETVRGWLLEVRADEVVFLSSGADFYVVPRDVVQVEVHGRNTRLEGLLEPAAEGREPSVPIPPVN